VKRKIEDIVSDVIEGLCYPSRVEMSVPCTQDAILLDESGKRIPMNKEDIAKIGSLNKQ